LFNVLKSKEKTMKEIYNTEIYRTGKLGVSIISYDDL